METLSTENADSNFVNDAFSDLENDLDFDFEEATVDQPYITIERGACFGRCPIYNMSILESGLATYEGIKFVDNIGGFQTNFTAEELVDITKQAKAFGLAS